MPGRLLWGLVGVALVVVTATAAACSSSPPESPEAAAPIRIGAFDFPESMLLANIYGRALENHGYRVELRPALGSREVVTPALQRGDIDLYPGYAASELEFFNKGASKATTDPGMTLRLLRDRLEPLGLTALDVSPAENTNAFAVTQATADKYKLRRLSDLIPVAGELVLGGPPECPSRPYCLAGLERTYGLKFKDFRPLDPGGPLSKSALEAGDIDVALVFSSDGTVLARGLVVLEDDRHLQRAENIVPLIRRQVATEEVNAILNGVSAELTTADLGTMNIRMQDEDPATLAEAWLAAHGLSASPDDRPADEPPPRRAEPRGTLSRYITSL